MQQNTKKKIKILAGMFLFLLLAGVSHTAGTAQAAKVYNNGGEIVETGGRIYFSQYGKGKQKGIFSFDLKTKKKKKIVSGKYESVWIAGNSLYYTRDKELYRKGLRAGGEESVYQHSSDIDILGFANKNSEIQIFDGKGVYQLTLSGEQKSFRSLSDKEDIGRADKLGEYMIFEKGKDIIYGTSPEELQTLSGVMKKIAKKSGLAPDWYNFMGVYGDYLYGYIYAQPGTIGWRIGYLFRVSLKNGDVKVYKKYESHWEAWEMRDGRIYTDDYSAEGKWAKTHVFTLDKTTGAVKHKTYPCSFNGTDGRYIYQAGSSAICRYDPKTKKQKVLDARYEKKKNMYYAPQSTGASTYLPVINGKLFYAVYDCRKEKYVGWRLMPDRLEKNYIVLKTGKRVTYATTKMTKYGGW